MKLSLYISINIFLFFYISSYLALIYFPFPWSFPVWFSETGNILYNFFGASYFNLGCKITGILICFYFCSLSIWKLEKLYRGLLIFLIFFGILEGYALIHCAIYPQYLPVIHSHYAAIFFQSLIIIEIFMLFLPIGVKLRVYGVISVIISFIFVSIAYNPVFEWITLFLHFSFYVLLAFYN